MKTTIKQYKLTALTAIAVLGIFGIQTSAMAYYITMGPIICIQQMHNKAVQGAVKALPGGCESCYRSAVAGKANPNLQTGEGLNDISDNIATVDLVNGKVTCKHKRTVKINVFPN